jgi:hypothetical protein
MIRKPVNVLMCNFERSYFHLGIAIGGGPGRIRLQSMTTELVPLPSSLWQFLVAPSAGG